MEISKRLIAIYYFFKDDKDIMNKISKAKYPLISIIIPVYNVDKYLDICMQSICSQDYENLEIILIDDGSQDSSPEICDKWSKMDNRIRTLHKKNGGVSSARNAGLEIATGDFITFVDPDDNLLPGLYSNVSKYFNEYEMIEFGHYEITESGKSFIDENCATLETVLCHKDMILKNYNKMLGFSVNDIKIWNKGENMYLYRAQGMVWQFLINAKVIRENNIHFKEKLRYQEDDIFIMECLIYSNSLKVISTPYYNYVQHPQNITHTISSKDVLEKKFDLLFYKNELRKLVLKKDNIDILDIYAGSNVLSVLQVASICVSEKLGYKKLHDYICSDNVRKSIKIIPFELRNLKFNIALFLLKWHAYRLVYFIVKMCYILHINVASGFS